MVETKTCNIIILTFLLCASVNVYVPKDRVTSLHQGYGFVEFRSEEDADYVCITGRVMVATLFISMIVCSLPLIHLCPTIAGYQGSEYD